MNLILLLPSDFINADTAVLTDPRRVQHIARVLCSKVGDSLKVGLLGGNMGSALITRISAERVELRPELPQPPPLPSPISLILALPRPQMLKRSLHNISALGVKELVLLQSGRVEKSYWQSPQLAEETIREALILGLEQSGDTRLPELRFAKRFRPFMEDELPALVNRRQALIAHPYASQPCPFAVQQNTLLAIGPEGGFLPQEVEAFSRLGFNGVTLGPRILRVETALTYLLGRLHP